jgi:hypothetical protein
VDNPRVSPLYERSRMAQPVPTITEKHLALYGINVWKQEYEAWIFPPVDRPYLPREYLDIVVALDVE